MTLFDDYVPGVTDGLYSVAVQQSVTYDDPDSGAAAHHYYRDHRFVVKGPRFVLPKGDVHACFPPMGGLGDYRLILPHVTLAKRHLPWERLVRSGDVNGEPAPWLALIVLSQREEEASLKALGVASTQAELTVRASPSEIYAAGGKTITRGTRAVHLPVLEPEDDETDTVTKALCLDLPAKSSKALLPNLTEATLLAICGASIRPRRSTKATMARATIPSSSQTVSRRRREQCLSCVARRLGQFPGGARHPGRDRRFPKVHRARPLAIHQ